MAALMQQLSFQLLLYTLMNLFCLRKSGADFVELLNLFIARGENHLKKGTIGTRDFLYNVKGFMSKYLFASTFGVNLARLVFKGLLGVAGGSAGNSLKGAIAEY